MSKIKVYLYIVFGLSTLFSQAQCGTDEMMEIVMHRDPSLKQRQEEMMIAAAANKLEVHSRAAIYTIPVVFHVIHTGGAENISREQILDQLRVLNADFQYKNWNKAAIRSQFKARAADCQIQFKLASIDPSGNCTDGINRIFSPLGVEVDQSSENFKALSYWDSKKYLNVWVVTSIKSVISGGTTLGYAYFPSMLPANKNGIVLRSDVLGSIGTGLKSGDSGRTLTHEVGHWLGLLHTFSGDCLGQGDFCDDTPPVTGTFTNSSCPVAGNSCTNDNPDELDLWEDYMDYAKGTCSGMFTANQKSIMFSYLAVSPRASVVSASNLIATGVTLSNTSPIANFTSSQRVVCAGSPVVFYDISCKAAVSGRSWTFAGASTPSSAAQNPVVTYQTAGKYKVTLLVQNASGNNTKSVDEYITVTPPSASYPNLEETFENGDPAGHGYRSITPRPWEWIATAGFTGNHCFVAPVKSTDTPGTVFSFVTPAVDLTKLSAASSRFTFYVSYAQKVATSSEVVRVFISTDCGNSFTNIYERGSNGTLLQYSGAPLTNNFFPTNANQWKRIGLTSLSAYTTFKQVIFKVDVVSNAGNPVYIDNVNISEWYAGNQTVPLEKVKAVVYPNPAQDAATIELDFNQTSSGTIDLYDLTGRKISNLYTGNFAIGNNKFTLNNPGAAAGALFLVKITTPDGQITKAITFAP